MMKRVAAIDLLRALAIVGMVASGSMLWDAGLPAAMFHAQLPPPTFQFNPEVPGITWVDLVFPFFLFSMGASMPLALRRREAQGAGWVAVCKSAIHRFVWLAAFAIILGNTGMYLIKGCASWVAALATLCVWLLFFAMFIRFPNMERGKNTILNWGGFILLIALTMLYKPLLGVGVSLSVNNIIILILANVALFGTLLWWATRNSLTARIIVIAAFAVLKLASEVEGSWCEWLWQQSPAAWLFRFEFLKYLCIVLSGSIIGDSIQRATAAGQLSAEGSDKPQRWVLAGIVIAIVATIVVLMWGLFVREVGICVILTAVLVAATWILLNRVKGNDTKLYREIYAAAVAMLLIGLIAEPMEGGIKKDPATIGYFFTTSAMAAMVLLAALIMEIRFNTRFKALEACGANPMFAYVAAGYLITPLLTLLGLIKPLNEFCSGAPWLGFARGVLFALLVIAVTYPLTRKNYYWKS
jgi:predicted acyltransferase